VACPHVEVLATRHYPLKRGQRGTVGMLPPAARDSSHEEFQQGHTETGGDRARYPFRLALQPGMVRSAILHTLQIDFSLQHVPYFSLQILKTLNKLTFGGPTVQTGLLPDPKLLRHLEEIAFSSSTSIRGQLSFGSFCLLCRRQASQVSGRHG
jgi:hypothetical protein